MDILFWLALFLAKVTLFLGILSLLVFFFHRTMVYDGPFPTPAQRSKARYAMCPNSTQGTDIDEFFTVSAGKLSRVSANAGERIPISFLCDVPPTPSPSSTGSQNSQETKVAPTPDFCKKGDAAAPPSYLKWLNTPVNPYPVTKTMKKVEFMQSKSKASKVIRSFKENPPRRSGISRPSLPPSSHKKRSGIQRGRPWIDGVHIRDATKRPALRSIDWNPQNRNLSPIQRKYDSTLFQEDQISDDLLDDILVYCSTDDFLPRLVSSPPAKRTAEVGKAALFGLGCVPANGAPLTKENLTLAPNVHNSTFPNLSESGPKLLSSASAQLFKLTGSLGRISGEITNTLVTKYQSRFGGEGVEEDDSMGQFDWEKQIQSLESPHPQAAGRLY